MKIISLIIIIINLFALVISTSTTTTTTTTTTIKSNLTDLFNKIQTNITQIIKDENFNEHLNDFIFKLSKLENITNITSTNTIISQIISTLNTSTTTQKFQENILQPFLNNFDLNQIKNIFDLFLSDKNQEHSSFLVKKIENFLKKLISQLLASKSVQNALKQCLSSAELVFGRIDLNSLLKQVQNGYDQAINNPETMKLFLNSLNQLKNIFFS
jgi:hypothetical protein